MSGEKGVASSGWTVDTLHQHLAERADLMAAALRQQILDQRDAAHKQIADLRTSTAERFADMRGMLDERHATQTRMFDGAFDAQHAAVRTALEGAEKAVQSALISAEKAVGKAELAADKRFESVNEFRQQLSDQTATFPSRDEVYTKIDSLRAQTDANARRISELELRLTSRLDTEQGSRVGGLDSRIESRAEAANQRASYGQIMQFVGLVLLALAIVASVLIAVLHKG
jgi:hypothetical protein